MTNAEAIGKDVYFLADLLFCKEDQPCDWCAHSVEFRKCRTKENADGITNADTCKAGIREYLESEEEDDE